MVAPVREGLFINLRNVSQVKNEELTAPYARLPGAA